MSAKVNETRVERFRDQFVSRMRPIIQVNSRVVTFYFINTFFRFKFEIRQSKMETNKSILNHAYLTEREESGSKTSDMSKHYDQKMTRKDTG